MSHLSIQVSNVSFSLRHQTPCLLLSPEKYGTLLKKLKKCMDHNAENPAADTAALVSYITLAQRKYNAIQNLRGI